MSIDKFSDRHIGPRGNDIKQMLAVVNASSVEQLINMEFGKVYEIKERNVSSGLRGIRRSIRDKDFIVPQFKAIKILLDEGFENIAIFPPMTNSIKEY